MTGDNGMPFPRCKANLYDCGVHVPLAARWAGRLAAGRRVEAFVSLTDLARTFLELAGVDAPRATTGRAWCPSSAEDAPAAEVAARDHVLCGRSATSRDRRRRTSAAPDKSLRTRDFLYIRNFRPDRWPAGTPDAEKAVIEGRWLADCDNGPTKLFMVDRRNDDPVHRRLHDLAFAKRPAEELYDLRKDPGEMTNVVADAAYAHVKEALAARLVAELEATGDPRVLGGAERLETYPYYGGSPTKPVARPRPK
jgi:arylsulfatase A-like enzyme